MTPILEDLHKIADPGPHNSFLLDRVVLALKRMYPRATRAQLDREIRDACTVTSSQAGPVLQGWALRKAV